MPFGRLPFYVEKFLFLEQVALNILENAVQHAEGMTTISLRVFTISGKAIFEISDNDYGSIKKLQVNMANIRKKFGDKPGKQNYVVNELGVGYRMCDHE